MTHIGDWGYDKGERNILPLLRRDWRKKRKLARRKRKATK